MRPPGGVDWHDSTPILVQYMYEIPSATFLYNWKNSY